MSVVVPLTTVPQMNDRLSLQVYTNELKEPYALDLRLSDVHEGAILSFDGAFDEEPSFDKRVKNETPCGDPYFEKQRFRSLLWIGLPTLAIGVAGVGTIIWSARRAVPDLNPDVVTQ